MNPKFSLSFQSGFTLSEILPEDRESFVKHMKCKAISDNTIAIPYPYSSIDADWWIAQKQEELVLNGRPVTFAIRNKNQELIGSVGFDGMHLGSDYRAELGYWLAEEYWGRGLMSAAVAKACRIGFDDLGLEKIVAHVFVENRASQGVLLKCGFIQEAYLKRHFKKRAQLVDALLLALWKSAE